MKQLVDEGDRLTSISFPGEDVGRVTYAVGGHGVTSIGVCQLPGPMGVYLVANVIFDDGRADVVAPLHTLRSFEVLNP